MRGSWPALLVGLALLIVAFIIPGNLVTTVLLGLSLVIPGVWLLYLYSEWTDDVIIITDQRVLRMENTLLTFRSHLSETPLSSIQEANYFIPSGDPLAHLFKYGTIQLNTAGQSGNVKLDFIPRPAEVQRLLFANQEKLRREVAEHNREVIGEHIDSMLGLGDPDTEEKPPAEHKPAAGQSTGILSTQFINEKGDTVYRKHISVWFSHILLPLFVIMAALGIMALAVVLPVNTTVATVQFVIGFFGLLVGGIWFYWADWDWRNDLYVIGSTSISLIHRRPLWLQNINDQVLLRQVDSVVSQKSGLVDTLFNRGNVEISLVGDNEPSQVFVNVPNPDEVQEEISRKRSQVAAQAEREEMQRQHRAIAEYLDVYHERVQRQPPPNSSVEQPPPPPPETAPPPRSNGPPPIRGGDRPPRIPRSRRD
jgi:hypothetical protein